MASKIEWTNETWNPATGCNKVSPGCKNCYAEVMHKRLMVLQPDKYSRPFLDGALPYEPHLELPLHWRKPRMIFVNSMSDLFHENVPFEFIDKVFMMMASNTRHTFQVLTKRPERALEYFSSGLNGVRWNEIEKAYREYFKYEDGGWAKPGWFVGGYPLNNVWLGVSVENQETADERIPLLLQIPAAVRWLSCEPLLGTVDLKKIHSLKSEPGRLEQTYYNSLTGVGVGGVLEKGIGVGGTCIHEKIHWVVVGGESGHGARPMHPDWARKLRDDCVNAGVPYFFKQWGGYVPSYYAGERSEEEAYYKNTFGKSWVKHYYRFDDGIGMVRSNKKAAGRLLDGREWNEYPKNNKIIK